MERPLTRDEFEELRKTDRILQDERHASNQSLMKEILIQAKTTNGRVSNLEKWQNYVLGFCACLTLLFVPILIAIALKQI
jgi:hypothetical protein